MDDRLSKSLDEIVNDRNKQSTQRRRRPEASTGRAIRGTRNDRRSDPYDARHNPRAPAPRREKQNDNSYDCAIKFLLSHHFAGSVIGNGGFAMKDLIEITEADIHISNPSSPFPGSQERVLFITGSESSLFLASALIWEMIGQQTHSYLNGMALVWNPAAAKASPGEYDDQEVECRLAIPAACGGRILGRGGAVFRKMSSDHQVETKMSPVQEQDILQERIISVQGTVSGCMAFTAELLSKMLEVPEECKYAINGTAYPRDLVNQYLDMIGQTRGGDHGRDTSAGRRRGDDNRFSGSNNRDRDSRRYYHSDDDSSNGGNHNRNRVGGRSTLSGSLSTARGLPRTAPHTPGVLTLSEKSVIEVAVPTHLVGAILGIRGSKIAEITALSGAQVQVSDKNDLIEGTNNRLVTITGTPINAQTAHTLIVNKIREEVRALKAKEGR